MKKLAAALLLVLVAGCTSSTQLGPCIGAFEDKDPKLHYKVDAWNVVMSILFIETIIVPVVVIANETLCPTRKNE